jgi:RNA polymerase sigma-70 factor (ECF subfamily)
MSLPATMRIRIAPIDQGSVTSEGMSVCGTPGAAEPTDEMLMTRIQQDDQEALGCLFLRYARLVRSIAARILRDAAEAEDLVQDLFLFIQRKSRIFDSSKGSAKSWVVQMTYSRAIDRRRYLATRHFYTRKTFQGDVNAVARDPAAVLDHCSEAVFGRNGIQKVLDALSEDQLETIRLFFFEGYTLREIGEKRGQPLENVRHHYYRALDRLRKEMFGRNGKPG